MKGLPPIPGTRLNIKISNAVRLRIESLEKRTTAYNHKDVVERALHYYDLLLRTSESGGRVILEDNEKQQTELKVIP